MIRACKKSSKFRDKDKFFSAGFISGLYDITSYFLFRGVACANLIHSADVCSLVMACVGYACAHTAKNPSELIHVCQCFLTQMYFYPATRKVNKLPRPGKIVRHVCLDL